MRSKFDFDDKLIGKYSHLFLLTVKRNESQNVRSSER